MFEIITIDELLKRLDSYSHKELHVHHTWSPSHKDFIGNNGLALQTGMRNYHVASLGWSDIGQHVTLLPDGLFVTGRDFGKTPASIQGYNTGGFACEMLGNFDVGNDVLKGPQKKSILRLAKYFNDKGRYIRFHRENAAKTCPGTSIDKEVFLEEVKGYDKELADYNMDTKELQWKLNWRGYATALTEKWDEQTQNSLTRFQQDAKLHVTGYLNVETARSLNNYDFKARKVMVEGMDITTANNIMKLLKDNGYNPIIVEV